MGYARALVEHPRWRWEPGMWTSSGWVRAEPRVVFDFVSPVSGATRIASEESRFHGDLPWLDDPATKGWLLHMLREATGTQDACATWLGGEWRLYGWIGASALGRFATEGEALAAALLAVWGQAQTETPEHTKNCSRITGRLNHDVCPECRKEPV